MSLLIKIAISSFLLLLAPSALADWGLNMPKGVTSISRDIYNLHMVIFWICVGIAVVVFSVLIYALIMHRKSRGVKPAEFHEHPSLEILWAIVPFIILVVMAIPATKVLINMDDTDDADVTIKITGYQWKWQYEYLDQGIRYFSNLSTPVAQIENREPKGEHYLLEVDRPLVVPINKKVRFLVTSNDVIHSWWVPELGIKRDAIPGFIHESWARIEKPGIYRGQCAELCGRYHGYMPIVVEAVENDKFKDTMRQLKGAKAKINYETPYPLEVLMKTGEEVYNKICAACHRVDGKGMPPVFPALKGSSVAVGDPISRHIEMILYGVPGSAMQAFENQLDDLEVAAVTTYERNAWGNNTRDVVQPKEVSALRGKEKQAPSGAS